jgi:hypothetical protein
MRISGVLALAAGICALSACGGGSEANQQEPSAEAATAENVDATATEMNQGGTGTNTGDTTTGAGTGSTGIGGTAGTGSTEASGTPNGNSQ